MKWLCGILFSQIIALGSYAQAADDIIQKHIAAIGGAENWRKIHSLKENCVRISRGIEIPVTIITVQGKGFRSESTINGMTSFFIFTDTAGWRYNPREGDKAEPMTSDAVRQSQDMLDIQGPLIDYQVKGNKVTYLGTDDVEGTECHKLKVVLPSGKEKTIYIDASNYYLVRIVTKTRANGKEQLSTATFGDYQSLPEGIIFPMAADGGGSLSVKSIEINKPVDENLFKPIVKK